jgi:hypothetical protein
MANTNTAILPVLLTRSMITYREALGLARTVNKDFSDEVAQPGDTIKVEVWPTASTSAVTPGPTAPANVDRTPTTVSIPLSNWRKADRFHLSEKDMAELIAGGRTSFVPGNAEQAVRALANYINTTVHGTYTGIYGFVGTPGTTPFATDTSAATQARQVLRRQLCPKNPRWAVLDADAEANATALAAFQDVDKAGDSGVKIEGELGRKFGINWISDDSILTHTAGTASGATTNNAGYAAGVQTVTLASAGTGTILVGDVITFAGQTQTYAVTSGDADVSNGGTITFNPGLKVALAASTIAITVKASHVVNLAYHPRAIALAMRPLSNSTNPVSERMSITDPETGVSLTLTHSWEYHQESWEFSALFGTALVYPELATRIAG